MNTTELILSADEVSTLIDSLDLLINAYGPDHANERQGRYAPGTPQREQALALIDRLCAARDLRTQLES